MRDGCQAFQYIPAPTPKPLTGQSDNAHGGFSRREFFAVGYLTSHSFVQNFPCNFQAAVRNKIACCTVAFATRSAFVNGVQSNSVGVKCLTADSSLCCTVVHFLHTLCSVLSVLLHFLTPKIKTDDRQEKTSVMVQHFKTTAGARRETHPAPYSKKAWAHWDDNQC